jgi:Ca-activated chloride channel family protein
MKPLLKRVLLFGRTRRGGFLTLVTGLAATLIWVHTQGNTNSSGGGVSSVGNQLSSIHPKTGIELRAALSHPMVVQGGDGTVYLDLTVLAPESEIGDQVPTDTVIVLDRSGSMGEDQKWYFATQAIYSLLDRLRPSDRIALVTFDTHAQTNSSLVPADDPNTRRIESIVRSLRPGASTNLGDALILAESIVSNARASERRSRVVLLSDGHANTGIVDPTHLAAIGRRIADRGSVLSTIGMGLGFNENLMASLADHGMGSFDFLEHLESLGTILARELSDSRQILAEGSEIRIHLPSGVELVDVAGFPFELDEGAAIIRSGQIFQNSTKRFTTTLRVDNHKLTEYKINTIDLSYRVDGSRYRQEIESDDLEIACVMKEREEEVVAAVDKNLFKDAWLRNNFGAVMKSVGDYVRAGKKSEARQLMQSYKSKLAEADALVPGLKQQADEELKELESRIDDAFTGENQSVKQNRAAKTLLEAGQERQREVNRNVK